MPEETAATTEEPTVETEQPETGSKPDPKHQALLADLAKERREKKSLQTRLQALEDAGKSELEKAQSRVTELEKAAQTHEMAALKLSVAFDKGLTAAQAKRLVGSSKEELEADADEILRDFAAAKRPSGSVDQGIRGTAPKADPRTVFGQILSGQYQP